MATTLINDPRQSHVTENQEENMSSNKDSEFTSEDEAPASRGKKRILRRFSDSSSDEETNIKNDNISIEVNNKSSSDSEEPDQKNSERKSRILINSDDNISDTEEVSNVTEQVQTTEYFPKRDRKKKLREKFKNMKSPRQKRSSKLKDNVSENDSENSDNEMSCLKIKQKLIEKSSHISLSVCDPDDSDDEENENKVEIDIGEIKLKSKTKTKSQQPKQIRMSAKEAMENMQKIKSESNRMLREKEVSLPYHRPKALSLKDIMSRRRPAVSSDGKSLPIKMNEEQLRHYAMQLEERQKEMMELCKSESEEEEEANEEKEANVEQIESNAENQSSNTKTEDVEMLPDDQDNQKDQEDIAGANDISFDQIANENIETPDANKINPECSINDMNQDETNVTDPTNTIDNDKSKEDIEMLSEPNNTNSENQYQNNTEESQIIHLHFDSEKPNETLDSTEINKNTDVVSKSTDNSEFSDDEVNYDDIDALIESAEILKDHEKKEASNSKSKDLRINTKPKLTGAPGMIISLDGDDPTPKPSGVELLKERFSFFVNLKKEEDMEKDREKKYKPGTQHIKLKQQLEEEIAEQRSLEWEKRLEEERLLKSEQNAILGDESIEDIEKIEKKLEETEEEQKSEEESGTDDEDLIEDDVDMSDKPQKRNPMLEDQAEESEDGEDETAQDDKEDDEIEQPSEAVEGDDNEDSDSSDESSESEDEMDELKPKKGRILKAFEDSDEEDIGVEEVNEVQIDKVKENVEELFSDHKESQDDEIQLAQANKYISEDLFPSQESSNTVVNLNKNSDEMTSGELGTFSILSTSKNQEISMNDDIPDKLSIICETQPSQANFDEIAGMCSGGFSQNLVPTQMDKSQLSPSPEIGDDVVALCTGKFYDNPFVSQINGPTQTTLASVQDTVTLNEKDVSPLTPSLVPVEKENKIKNDNILKSILDELDDPEYDKPKQNKFFPSNDPERENVKKRFIIDSDDETSEVLPTEDIKRKKKLKKRKLEDRALQISDDEEEDEVASNDESDFEDDTVDKVYEYDSEENEVEVQSKPQKKKRVGEFFENEAELTSEDEWAGSGDEDEAGLDRMEREEGDDEVFHQGKLQRELGQIHMREVLDQDKREVRLIQELMFEDADLGDGHRQRKFRWRNNDGEEELGTIVDEFGETQEDEFESEEQWRKQRHEREMFLRKMQESGTEEDVNTSINRTTIIKANLTSRTMSSLIAEVEQKPAEKENIVVPEKKTTKDIPSPKKPFAIFKQNYHGSLLTRGRGALARLAALATPLAGDDDQPKVLASARGNFVFAALGDDEPKPQKRKAEVPVNTPKLIKKMKTAAANKSSLFDRLKD